MSGAPNNLAWKAKLPLERRVAVCTGVGEKLEKLYPENSKDELRQRTSEFELNIWNRAETWNGYLQEIAEELSQLENQVTLSNFTRPCGAPSTAPNVEATFDQQEEIHGHPSAQHGIHVPHQQLFRTPGYMQPDQSTIQGHHEPKFLQDIQLTRQAQSPPAVRHVPYTQAQQNLAELFKAFDEQRHELVKQLIQRAPQHFGMQSLQLLVLQQEQQRQLFAQTVARKQSILQAQQLLGAEAVRQNEEEILQTQPTGGQSVYVARANSGSAVKRGSKSRTRSGSSSAVRGSRGGRGRKRNGGTKRKTRKLVHGANLEQSPRLNGGQENGFDFAITSEARLQSKNAGRANRGSAEISPVQNAPGQGLVLPIAQHSHMHQGRARRVGSGLPLTQMDPNTAQRPYHGTAQMAPVAQLGASGYFPLVVGAHMNTGQTSREGPPAPLQHEIADDIWQKLTVIKAKYRAQLHRILPIAQAILNGQPPHNQERFRKHLIDSLYLLDLERTAKLPSRLSEAVLEKAEQFIGNVIGAAGRALNATSGNITEHNAMPEQSNDLRRRNQSQEYAPLMGAPGTHENRGQSRHAPAQRNAMRVLDVNLHPQVRVVMNDRQNAQQAFEHRRLLRTQVPSMNNDLQHPYPVHVSPRPQQRVHPRHNAIQNVQLGMRYDANRRAAVAGNARPPVAPQRTNRQKVEIRHGRNCDPRLCVPHNPITPKSVPPGMPIEASPVAQDVRSGRRLALQDVVSVDNQASKMRLELRQGHHAQQGPLPVPNLAQSNDLIREQSVIQGSDKMPVDLNPSSQEVFHRQNVGHKMHGTPAMLVASETGGTQFAGPSDMALPPPVAALEILEQKLLQVESSVQIAFDNATRLEDFAGKVLPRAKKRRIDIVLNALGLPSDSTPAPAGRKRGRDVEDVDATNLASDQQDIPSSKRSRDEVADHKPLKEIVEADCRAARERNPQL